MTSYFCWKCKTKEHWANERCPKDGDPGELRGVQASGAGGVSKDQVRKVGRPRIHADRKVYMRELMRRKRAEARKGTNE